MKKAIRIFFVSVLALGVVGPVKAESRLVGAAGISQGTADGIYFNVSGDTVTGDCAVDGNTTLGDGAGDTVTSNAGTWTFPNPLTLDFDAATTFDATGFSLLFKGVTYDFATSVTNFTVPDADAATEALNIQTANTLYPQLAAVTNTFTGIHLVPDGVNTAPTYSFTTETGTGFYLAKAGRIGMAFDGVGLVATFDATAAVFDWNSWTCTADPTTYTFDGQFNLNVTDQFLVTSTNNEVQGTVGWAYNPGSDIDADLIKVEVTGSPKAFWDESEGMFAWTKGHLFPSIGIGGTPNSETLFLAVSTTQATIPMPLMTEAQRDAITEQQGHWVYNTDTDAPNFRNSSEWRAPVSTSAASFTTGCVPFADSASSLTEDPADFSYANDTLSVKAVTLDGRLQGDQGADVASADEVTLGADGNYFDVTGTTTINHITKTGWQAGAVVVLQFDASVTVTHSAGTPAGTEASILLAGAGDFSATADDTLQLVYDGTTFREISRTVI